MIATSYGSCETFAPSTGIAAAQARGTELRDAFKANQPITQVGAGRFDCGSASNVLLPQGVIMGAGMDATRIECGFGNNTYPGCAFETQGNGLTVLEDLTLVATCPLDFQSMLLGFGGTNDPNGVDSTKNHGRLVYRRVRLIGKNFIIYNWSGIDNLIEGADSEHIGGRWGAYNGASSSDHACRTKIVNSHFDMNSSYSTHAGLQSQNLVCFGARGGRMDIVRCTVDMLGNAQAAEPMDNENGPSKPIPGQAVNCAWVDSVGGIPTTQINLFDVHSRIVPNGAPSFADISTGFGIINHFGGSGSGLGGNWVER